MFYKGCLDKYLSNFEAHLALMSDGHRMEANRSARTQRHIGEVQYFQNNPETPIGSVIKDNTE